MTCTLEKDIESRCATLAKKRGWIALKFVSPQEAGWPDRLFIKPTGAHVWCEFKTKTGRIRPLQEHRLKRLKENNCEAHIIRSVEQFTTEILGNEKEISKGSS